MAIDPGDINWPLMGDWKSKIVHVNALAESEDTKKELQDPDNWCFGENQSTERGGSSAVRVIVSDMNIPAADCATIICRDILPIIQNKNFENASSGESRGPYGIIVLTLKLCKKPKQKHIDFAANGAKAILETRGCYDFQLIHTAANSMNERTVACKYPL